MQTIWFRYWEKGWIEIRHADCLTFDMTLLYDAQWERRKIKNKSDLILSKISGFDKKGILSFYRFYAEKVKSFLVSFLLC